MNEQNEVKIIRQDKIIALKILFPADFDLHHNCEFNGASVFGECDII